MARRQSKADMRGVSMMDRGPGSVSLYEPPKPLSPKPIDEHALDRTITRQVFENHYRKRILMEDVAPELIKRAEMDHYRGSYHQPLQSTKK